MVYEGGDMNKEIEMKIIVEKQLRDDTEQWLKKHAIYKGTIKQVDTYLNRPEAPFFFINEKKEIDAVDYLRVRETESKSYLCFKKVHRENDVSIYCDEYEVVIDNPRKAIQMMAALGYTHKTLLRKIRKIYMYDYFEVAFDEVENLGDSFMEIEIKRDIEDPAVGHELIREFLKKLGIKNYELLKQGYVRMIWNSSGKMKEV